MALSGDFSGFDSLRKKIADVSKAGFRSDLAQVLGAVSVKLVMDEFRQSRDPYGNEWDPLKGRSGKPLLDTGRMRASVNFQASESGFRINIPVAYAVYHQYGTRPHAKKERSARQNSRGRFVGAKARSGYLLRIKAHVHPGIPARPMLPVDTMAGIGLIWAKAYRREAAGLLRRKLEVS